MHLFAGEEAGYTLSRAFSDSGGDQRMLVEVAVKKEKRWKMDPTACLLVIVEGCVGQSAEGRRDGSELQNKINFEALSARCSGGGPKLLRGWSDPWGMKDIPEAEKVKVQEDDLMMWRGLFLYMVAEEMRKATMCDGGTEVKLGLLLCLSINQKWSASGLVT